MNILLRILLVEDNPGDADLILDMLSDTGDVKFQVKTVKRLSEALSQIKNDGINLALLDLGLPDSQGLDTFFKLRAAVPGVAIIILTGNMDQNVAVTAVREGAQDYLIKGQISGSLLVRSIRYALERKQAEAALKESEEQYRTLFEESKDAIFMTTPEGRFLDANPALIELYGYASKEEMFALNISTDVFVDPEDRKMYVQILKEKGFVKNYEHQLKRKDGKILTVLKSTTALRNKKGDIVAYRGINHDITERKQAEVLLKEAKDRLAQILNSTAEGIYGLDLSGNCTFCNPASIKLLGYRDENEIIGKNMHNLIHHTNADGIPFPEEECIIHKSLRAGKYLHNERELFWRADRSSVSVEYWVYPILKNNIVQGAVVSFVERTEQIALENQLRQAQKMEAIGTLTGGIAHDFNNILSAITSYGYVTLMKMPQDDPLRTNIEHIMESVDRAAALIKSLLAFSRKQALDRKPIDLNKVLKKLEKFLVRVIGEDVKVRMALGDTETTVFADAGQLEQVFMNLATNARDAMPQGGSFTIETAITELDNRYVVAHGYGKPGSYAMITVSDTGIGMNEETRMKIFDPFFTTKKTGKGTGLGLAMVYGIIKQHEGFINVYSEPGNGTTFRIYFPLSREAAVDEYRPTVSEDPIGGTETILLAEDDVHVRKITIDVLEQMGYTVISANDGEEAVKKYLEHKDKIQLLLFDLIMPKKNGKEAYDEIKIITPGIKGIFLTGYAAEIIQQKGLLQDTMVMLNKPISPLDLLKKVRRVLSESKS